MPYLPDYRCSISLPDGFVRVSLGRLRRGDKLAIRVDGKVQWVDVLPPHTGGDPKNYACVVRPKGAGR